MADPFAALSAAITMAGTGIAAAWAEKAVGCATVGAMAEKPELFGRCLILMVLPETIVVFGLVIALQLLGKVANPSAIGMGLETVIEDVLAQGRSEAEE